MTISSGQLFEGICHLLALTVLQSDQVAHARLPVRAALIRLMSCSLAITSVHGETGLGERLALEIAIYPPGGRERAEQALTPAEPPSHATSHTVGRTLMAAGVSSASEGCYPAINRSSADHARALQ